MQQHIITSAAFFQSALYANSQEMTPEVSETLLLLSTGHPATSGDQHSRSRPSNAEIYWQSL